MKFILLTLVSLVTSSSFASEVCRIQQTFNGPQTVTRTACTTDADNSFARSTYEEAEAKYLQSLKRLIDRGYTLTTSAENNVNGQTFVVAILIKK